MNRQTTTFIRAWSKQELYDLIDNLIPDRSDSHIEVAFKVKETVDKSVPMFNNTCRVYEKPNCWRDVDLTINCIYKVEGE